MFATAIRLCAKKPKPKMKPIELKTPPEQSQTISRVIFDIVKEHGPLTIADTWEHVKVVACLFVSLILPLMRIFSDRWSWFRISNGHKDPVFRRHL
ncbi:hypothetical protein BVC80_9051g42 [Macleaya cordata]|uniref:Uncharacterized protein n=1 Tax=Macleaya cordata TaxID=56857 RepID=A0A200R9Z4_MACCD|nr:hypothetical protein BVC80_9051g42 [Macleaya cordata]